MRKAHDLDKKLSDIDLLNTAQLEMVEEEFFNKVTQLLHRGGLQKAIITSAVTLTSKEKTRVKEILTTMIKQTLNTEFRVQESVLGGLRIHIGDLKLDATLVSQLGGLCQHLVT